MTDGWIKHDGGPCPAAPDTITERDYGIGTYATGPSSEGDWRNVIAYRIFAPVVDQPGPSDYVRETAARIMAAVVLTNVPGWTIELSAKEAVDAALALEKALKEVGK